MGIILIDTSSACAEFGYSENGKFLNTFKDCSVNSADSLAFEMGQYFSDQGIDSQSVSAVCLSNGPGSFTGLRIGLSFAKGYCFAANSELVLLNSLDVLANSAERTESSFIAAIGTNSSSGDFYYAVYENSSGVAARVSDYSSFLLDELIFNGLPVILPNGSIADNTSLNILPRSKSNLESLLELSLTKITERELSDPISSEPFYMREFSVKK